MAIRNSKTSKPAGYLRIQEECGLKVPPYFVESFVSSGARRTHQSFEGTREYYPERYWPGDSNLEHLEFALKYEGLNLTLLRAFLSRTSQKEVQAFVKQRPTSQFRRKLWYLFENFTGTHIELPNVRFGNYVDLLDPKLYYTGPRRKSIRHRINDNLPGEIHFSPLVRRTSNLSKFESERLEEKTREFMARIPPEIFQRAIDYLYSKETKSSYAIERETPDQKRSQKFVEALQSATRKDFLRKDALIELQRLIVDPRFANKEWRVDQVYIGRSLAIGQQEIHFIAPKPEDIPDLMKFFLDASQRALQSEIPPVVAAAIIAFPFVFLHPFSDGNGRIHRFLIHFVLTQRHFAPEGMVFPISATMLSHLSDYDRALESFSRPLMRLLEYDLDARGRLTVSKESADLYRYIDCTEIAETLFGFVKETIEKELPAELKYLQQYDNARARMRNIVDLPNKHADLFIKFCQQNGGKLGKERRTLAEYALLTDSEISNLESAVREAFGLSK
jgi:hypothetical protein